MEKITNNKDFGEALRKLDNFLIKGSLSEEEEVIFGDLIDAITEYEEKHYPKIKVSSIELLKFLMEQNELSIQQLSEQTGIPELELKSILSGNREIREESSKKLTDRFKLKEGTFIEDK